MAGLARPVAQYAARSVQPAGPADAPASAWLVAVSPDVLNLPPVAGSARQAEALAEPVLAGQRAARPAVRALSMVAVAPEALAGGPALEQRAVPAGARVAWRPAERAAGPAGAAVAWRRAVRAAVPAPVSEAPVSEAPVSSQARSARAALPIQAWPYPGRERRLQCRLPPSGSTRHRKKPCRP
jgi:hypothetical protein